MTDHGRRHESRPASRASPRCQYATVLEPKPAGRSGALGIQDFLARDSCERQQQLSTLIRQVEVPCVGLMLGKTVWQPHELAATQDAEMG